MPAQLFCGRTTLHVDAKADAQESLKLLRQFLRLLEPGSAVCCDQVKSLERLFVQVWRFRLNHLDSHDTERPDVDLGAVLFLLHDLGCHPVWCTDHGGTLGALLGKLSAEAEISDLDIAAR